jgi:hypothetical protein
MKKALLVLCLILAVAAFGKGLHWVKKGFSIRRVAFSIDASLYAWNEEADQALDQPFRYLGRGRQCFAFESQDGKYVLKLPRTDIYRIPFWMRALPVQKKRECAMKQRLDRKAFVLNSIRISHEELKEETGVFAIHFGETPNHGKSIRIADPFGFTYELPSHKTAFILQEKYPLLTRSCFQALNQGDRIGAEQILDAFVEMVVSRGNKGIGNKDGSFLRNYGFDGKQARQIDIGSFYRNPNLSATVQDTMNPVRRWLTDIDPAMLAYLEDKLFHRLNPPPEVQVKN